MKKLFLLFPLALALFGCMDINMSYKPTQELEQQYADQVKDEYLTVYYNVKTGTSGKMLMMSVKNTGNIFVKNLSFNYETDGTKSTSYNYKNIGNLKNRASKEMTIAIPDKSAKSITLDYSFTPVVENAFLNRDAAPNYIEPDSIKGQLTIDLSN